MTRKRKHYSALCLSAAILGACLEPQIAPDLPALNSYQFQIETVIDGLQKPWGVDRAPDGTYWITGNSGQLWRVENGAASQIDGLSTALPDMARDRTMTGGQGGLLDVALTPEFSETGELYLSYSYGNWDQNGTAMIRARISGDSLTNAETVFKATPAKAAGSHFGGRIAFAPDDTVLLTLGDGFALREEAQKPSSHLGSIIRVTRDGAPASTNISFGEEALPELFTIGHRNVQGLAVDEQTGQIWSHEHGPRGGDELNPLTAGTNYGWPIVTYGRDYQGARISPDETDPRFADPVHVWTPSIAPSGLAIHRGATFSDWNGFALIGGLASGDVRLVDPQTGSETILLNDMKTDSDPFRVRDVMVDPDGTILLLIEDAENGRLLRLSPK